MENKKSILKKFLYNFPEKAIKLIKQSQTKENNKFRKETNNWLDIIRIKKVGRDIPVGNINVDIIYNLIAEPRSRVYERHPYIFEQRFSVYILIKTEAFNENWIEQLAEVMKWENRNSGIAKKYKLKNSKAIYVIIAPEKEIIKLRKYIEENLRILKKEYHRYIRSVSKIPIEYFREIFNDIK